MAIKVYSSSIGPEAARLLPGIKEAGDWVLWVKPQSSAFDESDVAQLCTAAAPLQGIIWRITDGGGRTPRIKDHYRALGKWHDLTENLVLNGTLEYQPAGDRIYSDVAWVTPKSYANLANFLSNSMAGVDSTLAFVPNQEESGWKWANIASGLVWLWLCRRWVASSPQPLIDANAVVLSYVKLTKEIGGVAGLMWQSSDYEHGLVFYGPKSLLDPVGTRLISNTNRIDESAFESWLNCGVSLRLAP
jgi:hypothetical protein